MNDENDRVAALIQLAGKRPAVPADAAERVRAAVHEEWTRTARRRTRMRFAAAAAAIVILTIAGFVMMRTPAPSQQPPAARAVVASVESASGGATVWTGAQLRAGDVVETSRGGTVSLRWGKDTLRVDGDTRVRFNDGRAVFLNRGAVYVASSGAGVVVRTPLGDVRDVGTQFEVRVDPSALRVRVREGRIDLVRGGATHSAEAGVELTADAAGAIERHVIARSGGEWDWVVRAAPAIALEGQTLRAVVDRVSREKGLTAVYDGGVGDAQLHGNVPLAPEEALDAALAASAATARVEGDRLVVRRKR
jgi:ferric-dicitrate binding protein FerR (iron transport regulator)